jgi:hypothetical protein
MSEYKVIVKTPGQLPQIHDCCLKYFQSLGYSVKNVIAPSRIEFKFKGTLWTTDDIEAPHTLAIYLNPEGNEISLTAHFYCAGGISDFTKHSKEVVNSEMEGLRGLIMSSNPQQTISIEVNERDRKCVKCQRQIPWDANMCPYCGHKYG